MNYSLGNMLSRGGALNPDGLALDLQFAADKTLTARRGPTPTFSRASAATEVGSDGLIRYAPENLISRSQEFNDAAWTEQNIGAISIGSFTAPDGTATSEMMIASAGLNPHAVYTTAPITVATGSSLALSIYIKKETHRFVYLCQNATPNNNITAIFDLDSGNSSASQTNVGSGSGAIVLTGMQNVGNGWFRLTLAGAVSGSARYCTFGFASAATGNTIDSNGNVVFTALGSESMLIWGAQLERYSSARTYIPTTTAAVYGARFDHDPVTLASRGLLIEESRTNLVLNSDDFSLAFATERASIDPNITTAPNGGTTADKLVEDTTPSNSHRLTRQFNLSAIPYTFSVFAKASERSWIRMTLFDGTTGRQVWFDVSAGVIGTQSGAIGQIVSFGNGWWRCSITATGLAFISSQANIALATADNISSYTGDGTSGLFLWGAQLEAGSFPTSYIPTTTTALTRSADVCSITGSAFTGFYNQSEGTMLANAFTPASGDRTVLAADDNTANEMIRLRTEGTNPFFKVTDGGSEVVAIDAGAVTANTAFKLIGAYKVNDFASSINGGSAVTDTTGTIPTVDRMRIGAGQGGNTMCGCISAIRYFKKRLPDAKLQSLTT